MKIEQPNLLPDKPEEQFVPDGISPNNSSIQLVSLKLQTQIEHLSEETCLVCRSDTFFVNSVQKSWNCR